MKKRLFTTYMVLLAVGFMILGLITNGFVKDSYERDLNTMMASNLKLLKLDLEKELNEKDIRQLEPDSIAAEVSDALGVRVTLIDADGVVLGDSEVSEGDLPDVENHSGRAEFKAALAGDVGRSVRTSATVNIDYQYMAIPIEKNGEIEGAVRLAYPMVEVASINRAMLENIILSILIAFGISLFMAYRYSRNITRPIQGISSTARLIANGDLTQRVKVETGDEIQDLGDAFNTMTDRLSRNLEELKDQHIKIKSILSSISEGLVAVDNENRVMLINYSGKDFLEIRETDAIGKNLLGLTGNNELREALREILVNGEAGTREVAIGEPENAVLRISFGRIHSDRGARQTTGKIMVVRDITEMRNLEIMRSDFVANVSHELKTPLTSISGFVETLKEGAYDDESVRIRFLDIIEIESARLSRLIDDLLTLSNIETSQIGMRRKEEIDIAQTVEDVFEMVGIASEDKSIRLVSDVSGELPPLYGNRDWFKQMVLNLVDNAVKYTTDKGTVSVMAYRIDRDVFIKVRDSGIGIPEKEIDRLFERFYRVDKARSREVGGTGLGLAIVKHIVLAFDGDIKVRSEEGKGSEFIVRMPIEN